MGRETQRHLIAYRKEKDISGGATIDDEIIDALIEDANAREAKLGFFFCNKAAEPVWGAIAAPVEGGLYASKGWWRLEAGECAKVLKGELEKDHYYVYGVIEEARSERRLAGGDRAFCVNAIKFDITSELSCADQDLDEALFKRVEIGGAPSTTFDFLPDMFAGPPVQ